MNAPNCIPTIKQIRAREVLDSRGKPTVEVDVTTDSGQLGRAIVPSGASTGTHEAHERRDGDDTWYAGQGVQQAVAAVNGEIRSALLGFDTSDQFAIDGTLCRLDGTQNKSRLGANAILGVSLAAAQAAAASRAVPLVIHLHELWRATTLPQSLRIPEGGDRSIIDRAQLGNTLLLPVPMVNMISGGLHAGRNLEMQDFLIIPHGANSCREALNWTTAVYRKLGSLLKKLGYEGTLVGDEGGYGPRLESNQQALDLITQAIELAGLTPGRDVALALDVASSHFYQDGSYHIRVGSRSVLTRHEMVDLLASWTEQYPLVSIEDGCAEDDWIGWKELTRRLGRKCQLIGDDLFVTNLERLQQGLDQSCGNSVLIKLNQIGTLTETLQACRAAIASGYRPVISARSGETEDCFIADLAVATGAGQIKIGSIVRGERLAKYNQLLRLEELFGQKAQFAGSAVFADPERV